MGGLRRCGLPSLFARTWLSPEQTLFPMLYLLLQRDLQKISLARKHVLSESELPDALDTVQWVTLAAWYRVWDLKGEKVVMFPVILAYLASVATFEQQGLSPKEQFTIYAKSLVSVTGPVSHCVDLTATA